MTPPAFLDPLEVRHVGWRHDRPVWMTLSPLRYWSVRVGTIVVVPAEFVTDLASVPRWPLAWFVAGGRAPRPAVLHDYAYQSGHLLSAEDGRPIELTRREADAVFWEAMLADPEDGTNRLTAWLMWAAVRAGGRGAWARRSDRRWALNPEWTREGWA
ncbi:MAG TPA: DUF1353 domain-containing protein, partial [Actinomycetota bacterium]|nr:DUF1353 domain-containing protein [Actinomycetota bacterium]